MNSLCRSFSLVVILLLSVFVSAAEKPINVTHKVQLTNGTKVTGKLKHRSKKRLTLWTENGAYVTVPTAHLHTIARVDGSGSRTLRPLLPKAKRKSYKTIALSTEHKHTIRKKPTTQVRIEVLEWPGQVFLLWFPEIINNVWAQWDPGLEEQNFTVNKNGQLVWARNFKGKATVEAIMTPRNDSVYMEIHVKAAANHDVKLAAPHNCLHFSAAKQFDCSDYSRIFVRVKKKWRSFLDLRTQPGAPKSQSPASVIYREGFLESKRANIWKGQVENRTMPDRVDHPLIMCFDKKLKRAVTTASEDYQGLFYNQGLPYLHCIHSAQAGVAIPRGRVAVFREIIWFVDGGIKEAVAAYDRDIKAKKLKIGCRADQVGKR